MMWMKRTALALAAGAAITIGAASTGMAAPVSQSTATATGNAVSNFDASFTEVRRRGRHWRGRHGRRHYRRGRRGGGFWLPFVAAPLLYGGYAYGRGYGNSCYSDCRAFHGPRYCRYNWRRYC